MTEAVPAMSMRTRIPMPTAGRTEARIRILFHYEGSWGWGFYIDNVSVVGN